MSSSSASAASPQPEPTRAERAQARDGWRPPEEVAGTALRIGGWVPAGQGVMPENYLGVDGLPHSRLPLETATWDPVLRQHDWDLWLHGGQPGQPDGSAEAKPSPNGPDGPGAARVSPFYQPGQWNCTAIGSCEPCPAAEADLPYCQPWGNRIEVQCEPQGMGTIASGSSTSTSTSNSNSNSITGTTTSTTVSKGWGQCGKAPSVEKRSFGNWTTLYCIAGVVFFVLFLRRQHHLAAKHLAALNNRLNQS